MKRAIKKGNRTDDLLPKEENTADVDMFSTFITQDVPAFLKSDLGITPAKRILSGHSWGGTLALYLMLSNSSLFDAYLGNHRN